MQVNNGIKGRMQLQNVQVEGIGLDYINFNFKGRVFDLEVSTLGQIFHGSGQVVGSSVNGVVNFLGQKLIISGNITNLKVSRQS